MRRARANRKGAAAAACACKNVCMQNTRTYLEDAIVNREEGDVKGAAAEVEDEDVLLARLLVEAVGDRGRGRLVDDAHHIEARDGARVLGRLALRVVEVGRDGDDGILDLLAEEGLRRLLHLDEDHRRDLLRREGLRATGRLHLNIGLALVRDDLERPELHVVLDGRVGKTAADEALRVVHGVRRVERRLVLRRVADEALRLGEGDVRRGHAVTLVVGDDLDLAVLVDADARVGRAEVDADDVADLRGKVWGGRGLVSGRASGNKRAGAQWEGVGSRFFGLGG